MIMQGPRGELAKLSGVVPGAGTSNDHPVCPAFRFFPTEYAEPISCVQFSRGESYELDDLITVFTPEVGERAFSKASKAC